MRSLRKSAFVKPPINDLFALRARAVWEGFRSESWSFKWLCVYFVFEYVRPASMYPVIDVAPWTQIALLFAVVAAFMDKQVKWVNSPANILMILFFAVVMLSSVFAYRPDLSWDKIDIVVNWLLLYFLIVTIINTKRRLFLFVLLFLLVNFKMAFHGFISFASRGFAYTKWGVVGPPGWFGDSGDFGIAMVVFSAVAAAFTLSLQAYWGIYKKLLFYFMVIAGMVTIIGTSSRGAQLGLVAMMGWFLIKSGKGIKALIVVAIVSAGLYSVLPDEMFQEFDSAGDDGTSQDRLLHWEFGLEVIESHPGLGVGYENWLAYCNFVNPNGLGFNDRCRLPHNTYISAGAELGLTGLLVYIFIILYMFRMNAVTRKNLKDSGDTFLVNLSHGFDAGLAGYLVASVFFTVLFYPMLWLQLGLVVCLNKMSRRGKEVN